MAEQWTFGNMQIRDSNDQPVCLMHDNPLTGERARLIAAAPETKEQRDDLLLALQNVVHARSAETIAAARAAIAKATA